MIFHSLQLESFSHETEDEEKVREAMLNLLPEEVRNTAPKIERELLNGTHGNKIIILRIDFKKQGDVKKIFDFILENLDEKGGVEDRIDDDCNFFVRFDKQEAYSGKLRLSSQDSIQLKGKVAAYPACRSKAVEIMKGVWC